MPTTLMTSDYDLEDALERLHFEISPSIYHTQEYHLIVAFTSEDLEALKEVKEVIEQIKIKDRV